MLPTNVQIALGIKRTGIIEDFPTLKGWSKDDPLLPHQQVAAMWQYCVRKGINADQVGLGKTWEALALVMLLRHLKEKYRTLIVCESNVHEQWVEEARRLTDLDACKIAGGPDERAYLYRQHWDLGVSTYPLLRRDYHLIEKPDLLIFDESSYFRHHEIKTHEAAYDLSAGVPRIILLDGTPIQNSLMDVHGQTEILHADIFGSQFSFERRYCVRENVEVKRGNHWITESKITKYKNINDFKKRVDPYILRRTPKQVGVDMPDVVSIEQKLNFLPAQRRMYDAVRQSRLQEYTQGKLAEFREGRHLLSYACDSTATLGEDPGESVKFDWIVQKAKGDLVGEPIIVFSLYKSVLSALAKRLSSEGMSYGLYTGDNHETREEVKKDFVAGKIQFLLGTEAIKKGMNLQASAYMITIDRIGNPRAMEQLAGRMRRLSSKNTTVYMIHLIINNTVEEKMWRKLVERSALSDHVFDEQSEIFEQLSDDEIYELMKD